MREGWAASRGITETDGMNNDVGWTFRVFKGICIFRL
jgi:hypothetical protein